MSRQDTHWHMHAYVYCNSLGPECLLSSSECCRIAKCYKKHVQKPAASDYVYMLSQHLRAKV